MALDFYEENGKFEQDFVIQEFGNQEYDLNRILGILLGQYDENALD